MHTKLVKNYILYKNFKKFQHKLKLYKPTRSPKCPYGGQKNLEVKVTKTFNNPNWILRKFRSEELNKKVARPLFEENKYQKKFHQVQGQAIHVNVIYGFVLLFKIDKSKNN